MKDGELEIRSTNITSDCNPNRRNENSEQNNEPKSLLSKFRAAIALLTIEPFLLCYILCSSLSSIAVQRLNLEKACRVDLGHTKEKCDEWDGNLTISIQTMVADLTTWQLPLTSSIPAILILFIGAWSDRMRNRKALLLVTMFGELVSSFGLVLTTFYFEEWPLFITGLIESLPTAFSGGFSVALMGSYSYLADVTSLESRTFRLGIAALIVTLGAPAAIFISEGLLDTIGYYGIFGLTTALYLIGLMYTYFKIHDLNPINVEGNWFRNLISFFDPNNAWNTLRMAFKRGPIRMKIILVIAAHVVVIGPEIGQEALEYEYMVLKYNMNSTEINLYFSYSVLVGICGTAIAMALFCKYMNLHDVFLGIIAAAGRVVSSVVCALAPTKPWYYFASVIDCFSESGFVAIRSMGTKIVAPQEVARMGSLIGLVDTITPMIYTPMYTQMYKATEKTLPGSFFLLGAAMTVPAFFIFITLYMVYKKGEKDKMKNPARKERMVYENDVTEF